MKGKRALSLFVVLCMMASMLFVLPAEAAESTKWIYKIRVVVSTQKTSDAKNGRIECILKFDEGEQRQNLENTNQKGGEAYVDIESSYAPWELRKLEVSNKTTDGFKMYCIYVDVKGNNSSGSTRIFGKHYPGNSSDKSSGQWIDKNNSRPKSYTVDVNSKRNIKSLDNFDTFNQTININISGESESIEKKWSGKISDNYTSAAGEGNTYNCMSKSNAPEFSVSASAVKSGNASVSSNDIIKNIMTVGKQGFTLDKAKAMKYMNNNNINIINITSKIKFSSETTSGTTEFWKTTKIVRNAFSIENIRVVGSYYTASKDNNYFNNSGYKMVSVMGTVKTGGNNSHLSYLDVATKKLSFTSAYLTDGGNLRINAMENGKAAYEAKFYGTTFIMWFPYTEGADSSNKNLKLVIENAKIGNYRLWDEANHREGLSSQNNDGYLLSGYKIDAKNPTIEFSPGDGTDLSKWNKSVVLNYTPSETIYIAQNGVLNEGRTRIKLKNKGNDVKFRIGNSYRVTSYNAPAAGGTASSLNLSLSDAIEGEFDVVAEGSDIAGNPMSVIYSGIKLDNKAPSIDVDGTEKAEANGKKSYNMNVKIHDASNTGKLYYMFTNKSVDDIEMPNGNEEHTSGEMDTTLNKWAYIDQSDTQAKGSATAHFSVEKGNNFSGLIVYFAVDEAGNRTDTYSKQIYIKNEDTSCDIVPSNPERPYPSYNISILTNSNNQVSYAWKDIYGEYITNDIPYNGEFNTADLQATKGINGTYVLECKIVSQTGTNINIQTRTYEFDNEGPKINASTVSSNVNASQVISVYASDASGVSSGSARVVRSDGTEIEGMEEIPLNVTDGVLSQNVTISGIPSGAYALNVTAEDINGFLNSTISQPFYIRNDKPESDVNIVSSLNYNERPLISDSKFKLGFDVTESFINAEGIENQVLYYRVGTAPDEYSEWIMAGAMEPNGDALNVKTEVNAPEMSFTDGENTLFVQTAVLDRYMHTENINVDTIQTSEVVFYYDTAAPEADLNIEDVHTTESISGKLYVRDNINTELDVSCASNAVKIEKAADNNAETDEAAENNVNIGEYDITVSESVDTVITVKDRAGNAKDVKLVINGIDTTPPTASVKVTEQMTGERKDAAAEVTINDVFDGEVIIDGQNDKGIRFAFIPADKYDDSGSIADEYFMDNFTDSNNFKVTKTRSDSSFWEGESNIIYKAEVLGATGSWYLGVRAADILGNVTDIVFDDVLTAEDKEITANISVNPKRTEVKTIANVTFNVPVYAVPQDKILDKDSDAVKNNTYDLDFTGMSDEEKVDAVNLEAARDNSEFCSEKYSFAADANKDYVLYTSDDLGRTKKMTVTVEGVEFGAASGIKTTNAKTEWDDASKSLKIVPVDGMMCAADYNDLYVIVEPDDNDTLLLPIEDENFQYTNGLNFDESLSEDYKSADGKGYTKLIYDVGQILNENASGDTSFESFKKTTERTLTVKAFSVDADPEIPEQITEKTVVVSNIDNDAPEITWSVNPQVYIEHEVELDGNKYTEWEIKPVPSDVEYTFKVQDKESGITEMKVLEYETADNEGNFSSEEVSIPMQDEDGNPIDYSRTPWVWDGSEHMGLIDDYEGNAEIKPIPLRIEYTGDTDPYGVKIISYTFSDAYYARYAGVFKNSAGGESYIMIGYTEMGISTQDIIYKMPIEENTDYTVKYLYEAADGSWQPVNDEENVYYKNAKAVIEKADRGEERELYVSNNAGSFEKTLNMYASTFTFMLKDKYGYRKEVPVSLSNFDAQPGTIEYKLSNTEMTNKPITVTINVSDDMSGVGKVMLTSGAEEIALTNTENGVYTGTIEKNGAYSITMYDNAGNRAAKSFAVRNINTSIPEAAVTYSTEEYTSRPVTASITFSKPNVRITRVEPVAPLTESDYSVNYGAAIITFAKSGTLGVVYEDEYGNSNESNPLIVAVGNIDKTPPALEPVLDNSKNPAVVEVSFNKVDNPSSELDKLRKASEIFVTYGGITKAVEDENGGKNTFEFYQNGSYTFKIHDKEGMSSYLNVEIADIDLKAPKITKISWSYEYDEFNGTEWETKTANEEISPTEGKAGYIAAVDKYKVTNKDVNVTVTTDDDTRILGSITDEYGKTKERTFSSNGLFMFNTEKKNGLSASYGLDIEFIDKTAPVLDLLGAEEIVFYENPEMNTEYDESMLIYKENGKYNAYKAYDTFGGKETNLTDKVEVVDWGGFDSSNLNNNKFDSGSPYTITYRVSDNAHNVTEARRTVRLVGMYDTLAFVNGQLPDYAGRCETEGDTVKISLSNFSGTAYVKYQKGMKTMGQMKKEGETVTRNTNGEFEISGLAEGWYTFYIQTDKRDYFTIQVFLRN